MAQISLRISDSLAEQAKSEARRRQLSLNGYLTAILTAATDPELEGSDFERLRERFRRAGLLEEGQPPAGGRPPRNDVDGARTRASRGSSLSDLVSDDRDR